jgi:shikimate kinase
MNRCWILIGMMGAGKSSIGRALAELTERTFVDTDLILQQRLGRPISQIFQIYGEQAFRDHETSVIRGLEPSPTVLSTGGGIVLREENWAEFHRLGLTVFLDASIETLVRRLTVSKKKRPLLQVEDWEVRTEEILTSRLEIYRRADLTVTVDDIDLTSGAERVLAAIRQYESDADQAQER